MSFTQRIIPLILAFSFGLTPIVEAQDEPFSTVEEAVSPEEIEGQLDGTVEFEPACIDELMAADMEFAQAYSEFMACQGDPSFNTLSYELL